MSDSLAPPTYSGSLQALIARLPGVLAEMAEIRTLAFDAETAVPPAMNPDLKRLGRDLDAIKELVQEMFPEIASRLAQEEAGSLG